MQPDKKRRSLKRTKCGNCGTRFNQTEWRSKRRYLKNHPDVIEEINEFRAGNGLRPLTMDCIICQDCFNTYMYACSEGLLSSDSQLSQRLTTSESDCSQDYPPATPPPYNPTYWPHVEDNLPGPSRLNPPQPVLPDNKCASCPLLLNLNPEVNKFRLDQERLLFLVVNGELSSAGLPAAGLDSHICEPCYMAKLDFIRRESQKIVNITSQVLFSTPALPQDDAMSIDEDVEGYPSIASAPQQNADDNEPSSEESDDRQRAVLVPIPTVAVSGTTCFVCGKSLTRRLRAGKKLRVNLFSQTGIFVSSENRVCKEHLLKSSDKKLTQEAFDLFKKQPRYKETLLTGEAITELLYYLRHSLAYARYNDGRISFSDEDSYSTHDYVTLLGVTKDQFKTLHDICSDYLRNTVSRSTHDALAIFLMKMRLNPSHTALASLFHLTKPQVSICIKKIRTILMHNFVPRWLGYRHMIRDTYITNHTTSTAKILTGASDDQAIVVIDGTYLYYQKSTNYALQRKTYSLHKSRNLLKVMMVVSTTGYILAIEGPYFGDGSNNDSSILRNMQKNTNGFRSFFLPGDYIIEDRGFRDSNALMTELGYSIKMPHFLGKRSQHPTSEANESRLVTKIRWIVESVNGRIKNVFRFFRDTIPNHYIRNNSGYEMFQIACAMLNAFHVPIVPNDSNDKWLMEKLLERSEMANLLQEHLENGNFLRQTLKWERLTPSILDDFPKLSMAELREYTFGVYQIKQAPSYIADTVNDDGQYDIFYHQELGKNAVRFKIQSRHQKSKKHDVWIGYNDLGQGIKSITGWYCRCPNGSRVVGCCAHIAAIIWYLSYARHCRQIFAPAANLASGVRNADNFTYENEFMDISPQEEEVLLTRTSVSIGESAHSDSSTGSWLMDAENFVPDFPI